MIFQNYLTKSLDKGYQVDTIYTDFRKAFDKVNHTLLYHKLIAFGFGGNFLNWIYSYLTNRKQLVKILFYYSDEYAVTSGVPQGSHLGPLLFLIFINDLPLVLDTNVNILLFADDAKLYFDIKSINDANRLQSNLNKFFQWSER